MPCVLIVEDDKDILEFIQYVLRAEGYETMCAHNGREALEQMHLRKPCVVLLDLHMPVMDGWEFRLRQLQDDPQYANIPVVAVTACYDARAVEERLGIKCLRKPLMLDLILTEVQHACGGTRQ